MSSRLQVWPLKNMSALVPQLYCCGQVPELRPPSCSEQQLPSPILPQRRLGRYQYPAGVVFLRPHYAGVVGQLLPEVLSLGALCTSH